jgi:hypothetical protein
LENPYDLLYINIYDLNGRLVFQKANEFEAEEIVNLNNFKSGVYFIEFIYNHETTQQKVIKN